MFVAICFGAQAETPETEVQPVEIEPVYQVEFVVLRPRYRDDLSAEEWPEDRPERSDDELFNGEGPAPQPLEELPLFAWVDEEAWDLPNTVKRLRSGGNYEVLMHLSWRQQTTARDNAIAYNVKLPFSKSNQPEPILVDENLGTATAAQATEAVETASRYSAYSADELNSFQETDALKPPEAGLIGQLSFSQARYLHLTVDLLMAEYQANNSGGDEWKQNWNNGAASLETNDDYSLQNPITTSSRYAFAETLGLQPIEKDPINYYHLKETRRIKTEQTHYFDHPAFGVLAHVRRLSDEELLAHQAALIGESIQPSEQPDQAP